MSEEFEPKILAYCCQWCSYAAADLAGSMRLQYPPNVRIIRVPCTGRVDTLYMLRAIEDGADGVFLSGCLLDDCHYVNGNYKALKRVEQVKGILRGPGHRARAGGDVLQLLGHGAPVRPNLHRLHRENP